MRRICAQSLQVGCSAEHYQTCGIIRECRRGKCAASPCVFASTPLSRARDTALLAASGYETLSRARNAQHRRVCLRQRRSVARATCTLRFEPPRVVGGFAGGRYIAGVDTPPPLAHGVAFSRARGSILSYCCCLVPAERCLVPAAASSRAARAICWQLCQHRGAGTLMSIQARPPAPPLVSRGSSHQGPLKGGGAPSSRRAAARRRPAVDSGEMTDSGGTVRCRAGVP